MQRKRLFDIKPLPEKFDFVDKIKAPYEIKKDEKQTDAKTGNSKKPKVNSFKSIDDVIESI